QSRTRGFESIRSGGIDVFDERFETMLVDQVGDEQARERVAHSLRRPRESGAGQLADLLVRARRIESPLAQTAAAVLIGDPYGESFAPQRRARRSERVRGEDVHGLVSAKSLERAVDTRIED